MRPENIESQSLLYLDGNTVRPVIPTWDYDFGSGNITTTGVFTGDGSGLTNLSGVAVFVNATVGPSGDYATVEAAFAAGETRILITGNTTETGNISWGATSRTVYVAEAVTWDLGAINHTGSSTLVIHGSNRSDSEVQYALAGAGSPVDTSSGYIQAINIRIDNNSTAGNTPFAPIDNTQSYTDVDILLPNQTNAGISVTTGRLWAENIRLNGGGGSCTNGINVAPVGSGSAVLSNVALSGTFPFTPTLYAINIGSNAVLSGLTSNTTQSELVQISGGSISNVSNPGGNSFTVAFTADNGRLSDFRADNGVVDFQGSSNCRVSNSNIQTFNASNSSSSDNVLVNCQFTNGLLQDLDGDNYQLDNCRFTGAFSVDVAAVGTQINNCRFASTLTISGDNTTISGSRAISAVTVNSDRNLIDGLLVGTGAGGGGTTLTVNGDDNYATGVFVDAAVVNTGTGNDITHKEY